MIPDAWSYSALEAFENCPRQYYQEKVLKRFPYVEGTEQKWGKEVHRYFEHYLVHGTPLPAELDTHREFLDQFKAQPGELAGEERIALDVNWRECAYFSKSQQVWFRGQVDARKRNYDAGFSHVLDHKTGKVKNDYAQLKAFAMWEFVTQPQIHTVKAEYYWTQIRGVNGETYYREQLPEIIEFFRVKLDRFADAFLTETFPAKQSGLCRGWCPVTDCEFWQPKRERS